MKGTLKGLGVFGFEIIGLISAGEKEKITTIEEHMESGDLVEYIEGKYDSSFSVNMSTYDCETINKYFSNYSGYIEGNENRKYCVSNADGGLLLILSLIMEKVTESDSNWQTE
ncbi:hypothetical protein LJB83_01610 [Clostridia bacterium OttesenSCG-928-F22]|nr:hypothetical protein [Clostridia bacterium OttesenSCG-928-F22]